jgi:hypothetical protein
MCNAKRTGFLLAEEARQMLGQNLEVWGRPQDGRSCVQIQFRAHQAQDTTGSVACMCAAHSRRAPPSPTAVLCRCHMRVLRAADLSTPPHPPGPRAQGM